MKLKKILLLCLTASPFTFFTACTGGQPADQDNYLSPITDSRDSLTSSASSAGTKESSPAPAENDDDSENTAEMMKAYRKALETLINNHIFPDGTDCGYDESYDISENTFSIYDVDGDGKEELLIMYGNTFSAAMTGYVLGYDDESGSLKTELKAYPMLTFYDNGTAKGEWSHNQGLAGDFWPYDLYQYNSASDTYELAAMVDAWDKNLAAADSSSNPFPDDIDKSQTGFVYYIMTDGQYDTTHPVDAADYNAWLASYNAGASECQIEYQKLTQDNISMLK